MADRTRQPAGDSDGRVEPRAEWFSALSDARLMTVFALSLFALGAWPLTLVDLPPLQDLPNHLATAHIAAHPGLYPEYVFNGFWKSNSLLTLWLYLVGGHGLLGAGRAFTAIVLAVNAFALRCSCFTSVGGAGWSSRCSSCGPSCTVSSCRWGC